MYSSYTEDKFLQEKKKLAYVLLKINSSKI